MTLVVWVAGVYGAVVGGALASFLGVVTDRVPAGRPPTGRSHCACGRQLRWWENVPVLGWLRIRGTARCCGAVLPVTMLASEVGLSVWGAAVFATVAGLGLSGGGWGWPLTAGVAALAAGCGTLLALTWPRDGHQP